MADRVAACFVCGLASAALGQGFSDPGPYHAGQRQVSIQPAQGTAFTALLYYPATQPGPGTPLNQAGGPYAAISFGHGFAQIPARYSGTLQHLATWGFLVIASETQTGLSTNHAQFAIDLRECLSFLEREHARPGSFLFGAVDTGSFGLSGHSMGGGASVLAAADDPRVRALANLAAAETTPSAVAAAARLSMPASFISGSQDAVVPYTTNGQRMFNAAPGPRQLPLILGGSHCGFQDDPFPLFCDTGSLPRPEQLAITRRLLTAFFLLYLREDQSAWSEVWGPEGLTDPRIQWQRDPRVGVSAPASLSALPGESARGEAQVRNTGSLPVSFALIAESAAWPVTFDPPLTEPLSPGGSTLVSFRVGVPRSAAGNSEFLLTARSNGDGGTRGFATVCVEVRCPPDCDTSTGPGVLDIFDFLCFQNRYDAGSEYACDCDLSTGPGVCDIFDFLCFQNEYQLGCP